MATNGLYGNSPSGATVAAPGAATVGLYGSGVTGQINQNPGAESVGLYGQNAYNTGSTTYFEYLIFQDTQNQPATPTGGSWSFTTNTGTPPAGWSNTPPTQVTNRLWISIGLVNSNATTPTIAWSIPGTLTSAGSLPEVTTGANAPTGVPATVPALYVQTGLSTGYVLWAYANATDGWEPVVGGGTGVNRLDQLLDVNVNEQSTFTQVGTVRGIDGTSIEANSGFDYTVLVGNVIYPQNSVSANAVTVLSATNLISYWELATNGNPSTAGFSAGSQIWYKANSISNNDVLTWDATQSKWINKQTTNTLAYNDATNTLTSTVNGIQAQVVINNDVPATTNVLDSLVNTMTSTVNGVADSASIVNTVGVTAGTQAGTLKVSVNGVASGDFPLPATGVTDLPYDVISWTNDAQVQYVSDVTVNPVANLTILAPASNLRSTPWQFTGIYAISGFANDAEIILTDDSGRTVSGIYQTGSSGTQYATLTQVNYDRVAGGGFNPNQSTTGMTARQGVTAISAVYWTDASGTHKISQLNPDSSLKTTYPQSNQAAFGVDLDLERIRIDGEISNKIGSATPDLGTKMSISRTTLLGTGAGPWTVTVANANPTGSALAQWQRMTGSTASTLPTANLPVLPQYSYIVVNQSGVYSNTERIASVQVPLANAALYVTLTASTTIFNNTIESDFVYYGDSNFPDPTGVFTFVSAPAAAISKLAEAQIVADNLVQTITSTDSSVAITSIGGAHGQIVNLRTTTQPGSAGTATGSNQGGVNYNSSYFALSAGNTTAGTTDQTNEGTVYTLPFAGISNNASLLTVAAGAALGTQSTYNAWKFSVGTGTVSSASAQVACPGNQYFRVGVAGSWANSSQTSLFGFNSAVIGPSFRRIGSDYTTATDQFPGFWNAQQGTSVHLNPTEATQAQLWFSGIPSGNTMNQATGITLTAVNNTTVGTVSYYGAAEGINSLNLGQALTIPIGTRISIEAPAGSTINFGGINVKRIYGYSADQTSPAGVGSNQYVSFRFATDFNAVAALYDGQGGGPQGYPSIGAAFQLPNNCVMMFWAPAAAGFNPVYGTVSTTVNGYCEEVLGPNVWTLSSTGLNPNGFSFTTTQLTYAYGYAWDLFGASSAIAVNSVAYATTATNFNNLITVNQAGAVATPNTLQQVLNTGNTASTTSSGIASFSLTNGTSTLAVSPTGVALNGTALNGTVTSVTATAPISITGTATTVPNVTISQANASTNGFLSSTDWTTFNGKGSGTVTSVATGVGLTGGPVTSTGTIALANTAVTAGSYKNSNITVDAQGRLSAASNGSVNAFESGYTFVNATGQIGQFTATKIDGSNANANDFRAGDAVFVNSWSSTLLGVAIITNTSGLSGANITVSFSGLSALPSYTAGSGVKIIPQNSSFNYPFRATSQSGVDLLLGTGLSVVQSGTDYGKLVPAFQSLTTSGTGAATLTGGVLNIPTPSGSSVSYSGTGITGSTTPASIVLGTGISGTVNGTALTLTGTGSGGSGITSLIAGFGLSGGTITTGGQTIAVLPRWDSLKDNWDTAPQLVTTNGSVLLNSTIYSGKVYSYTWSGPTGTAVTRYRFINSGTYIPSVDSFWTTNSSGTLTGLIIQRSN